MLKWEAKQVQGVVENRQEKKGEYEAKRSKRISGEKTTMLKNANNPLFLEARLFGLFSI